MTTEDYSWVVLAFQASYTVMQTVAGAVLDALGTRLGFFLFAVGWALANMAHALATGWPSLALFRALLGASEAARDPGGRQGGVGVVSATRALAGDQRLPDGDQRWQHDRAAAGRLLHPRVELAGGVHRHRRAQPGLGAPVVLGLPQPGRPSRTHRGRPRRADRVARRGRDQQARDPQGPAEEPRLLGDRGAAIPVRAGVADLQFLHPVVSRHGLAPRPEEHRIVGLDAVPRRRLRQPGRGRPAAMADEARACLWSPRARSP